jgi:hypothetical protein
MLKPLPVLALALAVASVSSARAQGAEEIAAEMARLTVEHMTLNYICRDAIGGMGAYQFARTLAVERGVAVGMDSDAAVLMVAELDAQIRAEDGAQIVDAGFCLEEINELSHRLKVLSAEFRQAR